MQKQYLSILMLISGLFIFDIKSNGYEIGCDEHANIVAIHTEKDPYGNILLTAASIKDRSICIELRIIDQNTGEVKNFGTPYPDIKTELVKMLNNYNA